jgi:site-specific DNA recombinase
MDAEGDATAQRTRELIALLEDGPDFLDHPDTELCGALVAEIIVESNDTLRFPPA